MYARVAVICPSDPMFFAENFHKAPIKLIIRVLSYSAAHKQRDANSNSVTSAKLAMVAASALGATSSMKIQDFLPYDLEESKGLRSEETTVALKWALKHKKMPAAITGLVGSELRGK